MSIFEEHMKTHKDNVATAEKMDKSETSMSTSSTSCTAVPSTHTVTETPGICNGNI